MKRGWVFVFALFGCAEAPDADLIGPWRVDATRIEIPELPTKRLENRVRREVGTITLKLRQDHTFTLALREPVEGTWTVEGETLTLTSGDKKVSIKTKLSPNRRTLRFNQETRLGTIEVTLYKSG